MEAPRCTEHFRESRVPKFVEWLEEILVRTPTARNIFGDPVLKLVRRIGTHGRSGLWTSC
jgi:hypothetical protein